MVWLFRMFLVEMQLLVCCDCSLKLAPSIFIFEFSVVSSFPNLNVFSLPVTLPYSNIIIVPWFCFGVVVFFGLGPSHSVSYIYLKWLLNPVTILATG